MSCRTCGVAARSHVERVGIERIVTKECAVIIPLPRGINPASSDPGDVRFAGDKSARI